MNPDTTDGRALRVEHGCSVTAMQLRQDADAVYLATATPMGTVQQFLLESPSVQNNLSAELLTTQILAGCNAIVFQSVSLSICALRYF